MIPCQTITINFLHSIYSNTKNVTCYFNPVTQNLTKTKHQSIQILSEWHVSDHSNYHQVYTDITFTGKCIYIKLPSQYLWDNTSLQKNLLFLALQSLAARKPLPQLPYVFSVLRLTYQFPYTCKSLLMLGCLRCFHLVSGFRRFSRYIFFIGWGCQPHAQAPTWSGKKVMPHNFYAYT